MKLVTNNEEPVEPAPSWLVRIEIAPGNVIEMMKHGYPSYSGPLFAIFPYEEGTDQAVFLCPYHKIVFIDQVISMGTSVAN